MTQVGSEIISLLTGMITKFATAFGTGLGDLVKGIFLETSSEGSYSLSVFGGLCIIFAGISLTMGLSRFVLEWVTSFGN